MANKTLLEVVQSALAATGGDSVSSISESPEAEDMALIARDVFNDIQTWEEWPHQNKLATTEVPSDPSAPTVVRLKDDVRFIHKVQYLEECGNSDREEFTTLCYVEPELFLDHSDTLMNHEHSQKVTGYGIDPSTFVVVGTCNHPKHYTTFDDEHLIFDSYNSDVDGFISNYKTRVMASVIPEFDLDDSYEIAVPIHMMGLYMSQVRVAAFYYLNQVNNPLDGNKSLRHMAKLRNYKSRVTDIEDELYPRGVYGRRSNPTNHRKLGRR